MSEDFYAASYQYKESHQSSRLNITTTNAAGIGPALDPIGPASSFCERCKELVYPLEGLVPIMNVRYHKKCFKCSVCSTHLDLKTYHTNLVDLNDKRIYCIAHKPKDSKPLNSLYSLTRSRSRSPGFNQSSNSTNNSSFDYANQSAISSNHSHSGSTSSSSTFHNENAVPYVGGGGGTTKYELPVTYNTNGNGSLVEKVLIDSHNHGQNQSQQHNSSNHNSMMNINDAALILKDEIGWKDDVFTPQMPSISPPSPAFGGAGQAVHHKEGKEMNYHRKEVGSDFVTNVDRKEQENKYKYESANQSASSVSKTVDQVTHTVIGAAVSDPCYTNGTGVTVNIGSGGNSPNGHKAITDNSQHFGAGASHLNHSNSGSSVNTSINSSQNVNSNSNVNYTGSNSAVYSNNNTINNSNSLNRNENYSASALINAVADDINHRHDSSNRHISTSSSAHDSSSINHPVVPAGTGTITISPPNIKLPNIGNLNIGESLPPGASVLIQEKSESSQHSSSQTIVNNGGADVHHHVNAGGNVTSITKIDKSASSSEHQVKIVSGGGSGSAGGVNIISGHVVNPQPSIDIRDPQHEKNIVDLVPFPINPPSRIPTVKPREPFYNDQDEIVGSNKGFGTIKLTVFYCDQQQRLSVTVHEAKNLIKLDKKGKSDPFARVYLLPDKKKLTKKKTKIVKDQSNPVWEETFDYQVSLAEASSKDLLVNIKDDKGLFEKQETQFLGEVLIDLRKTEVRKQPYTRWFYLQPKTRESELLFNSDNNTLVL